MRQLGQLPGVTVTGSVADVRPYVRRSAVMVAPLNIARGTQNKILEAMAMGVPVVTSRVAAGGVDAEAGAHLVVADSPTEQAAAILSCSSHPGNVSGLSRAGRAARAVPSCVGAVDEPARCHRRALHFSIQRMPRRGMKISIFGLGYVGAVSLACLARDGHDVIGVDIDPAKLELIAAGKTPVVEEGMVELMAQVAASGRVEVTDRRPTRCARKRFVAGLRRHAVGANGSQDQSAMVRLAREIGVAIGAKHEPHVVVFRSTLVPGTVEDVLRPMIEEASGKRDGDGFPPLLSARVPARRLVDSRLRQAAVHDRRCNPCAAGRTAARVVRAPAVRVHRDLGACRRDGEVLLQQLSRAEDHVRQRDGAAVRRDGRRSLRGDGPGVPGHAAQHLAGLSEAGLRVRRLVPAEGSARDATSRRCTMSSCRCSRASCHPTASTSSWRSTR